MPRPASVDRVASAVTGHGRPLSVAGPQVEAFLTHLAAERRLLVSSHRQALSALLFLYGKVLGWPRSGALCRSVDGRW